MKKRVIEILFVVFVIIAIILQVIGIVFLSLSIKDNQKNIDNIYAVIDNTNYSESKSCVFDIYNYATNRLLLNDGDIWDNLSFDANIKTIDSDSVIVNEKITTKIYKPISSISFDGMDFKNKWIMYTQLNNNITPNNVYKSTENTFMSNVDLLFTFWINNAITEDNIVKHSILENGNYFVIINDVENCFIAEYEITKDARFVRGNIKYLASSSTPYPIVNIELSMYYNCVTQFDFVQSIEAYYAQ